MLDQFSDPGGAQQGLVELLGEVRERGGQALVGLPGDGPVFERVRALGFETARIECGPYGSGRKSIADVGRFLWQMPRLGRQIREIAREWRADLIYVNGPRLLPAIPTGGPVVFHAHSYLAPGAIRHLAGRALRRTEAHIIANCEFVAGAWRGYVPAERVSVIYNGVDGGAIRRPGPAAGAGPAVVACIGRIAPEKGQLDFVAVAARIHRELPEVRFRIVGAPLFGDRRAARYHAAVRAAAVGLPIEFAGWVEDAGHAFARIDLLLAPCAAHEATTRVIFEAYAAGVPAIAFPSGGIPEVVEDGVTGRLAGSAEEMAGQAIELLRDAGRRGELAQAARECWQRRFTPERRRRELWRALECAAGDGRARRRPAREEPRPSMSSHSPRG